MSVLNPEPQIPDTHIEAEIADLARRYGSPRRIPVTLNLSGPVRALTARRRRVAEVVFAIVRPGGKILLHTKSFYPPGGWRLPSGSMEAGEGIEQTLRREVAEETSLEVEVDRFLAVIDYDVLIPGKHSAFRSYVFLLRETGGALRNADAGERVTAFREIAPSELPAVADALEALGGDPDPAVAQWADWGKYRAVAHRVVSDALQASPGSA